MKKVINLLSVALLIGATSCTEEIIVQNNSGDSSDKVELTFRASTDEVTNETTTRTLMREGLKSFWVSNDRIGVYIGGTNDESEPFITKDGGIIADFRGTAEEGADLYCALYPYNPNATLSNYVFTTVLHDVQYAEPDSYASGMNLAVSRSFNGTNDLDFGNSVSYLRVIIPEDYNQDDIYSMSLTGNNGEFIAGDVTTSVYSLDQCGAEVINNENAATTIILTQVNEGAHCYPGKSYYFVLAPTNMTAGYTLSLTNKEGKTATITGEPTNFERNHVYTVTIGNDILFDGLECGTIVNNSLFTVTDRECLYRWANMVAEGDTDLGCILMADIDFDGETRTWPILGTDDAPFVGRIVGNDKTISNFEFNFDDTRRYAGFVAVMGEGGSVENLTFDTPTVTSEYEGDVTVSTDDGCTGVIVARLNNLGMFNYTGAAITNCRVNNPTVTGCENVGGIVGRSYGRGDAIKNCSVSGGEVDGHMFVGGIAGNSEGKIEKCYVYGRTVVSYHDTQKHSEARVGGIVGTNNSGQLVACTANAAVDGSEAGSLDARYCGGIAGANNGTMVGCAFTGTVSGDYGGALAGESYGDIYGCYANNATAKALIYKVKRNLNYEFGDENQTDVVFPTFNGCYWVGASGSLFGEEESYVEEHATITNSTVVTSLSNAETSNMNAALTTVNNDSEYAYGSGYQYTNNTGDDSTNFPVKATVEQQVQ